MKAWIKSFGQGIKNFHWHRSVLYLFLIGAVLGIISTRNEKAESFDQLKLSGETMGTTWSVVIYPNRQKTNLATGSEQARILIQSKLNRIDQCMSTYKSDSDVSRFNQTRSLDWVDVSPETAEVVQWALKVSEQTGGAFDITVGPLIDLWRFGPDRSEMTKLPEKSQIEAIRQKIGYKKLAVRFAPTPALKKTIESLSIDLSAIAKGYAVDKVVESLLQAGFENFMVEVGGETRCQGSKPLATKSHKTRGAQNEGRPFVIAIESPYLSAGTASQSLYRTVRVPSEMSIATSGDYHNFRQLDGILFSHIIDPRTGFPVVMISQEDKLDSHLASVSVVTQNCGLADAYATALFVMGEKAGLEFANQENLPVLFLSRKQHESSLLIEENASEAFRTTISSEKIDKSPTPNN